MEPADSIRRLGFARWYERRLIEGHAWFVSGILCLIVLLASMEELSIRASAAHQFMYAGIAAAAATVGVFGLRRYMKILVHALRLGEGATCRRCGSYARFNLISHAEVRCRNCANEWRLIQPGQLE